MPTYICPLCLGYWTSVFHSDKTRDYFRCCDCKLVFVPNQQHLSPAQEKAIYDLHQNHCDDAGYRRFLSRLAEPLLDRLCARSRGLDFGCGPGPLLANMLREHGYQVRLYDPFYANDVDCLMQRYDFITCTEVVEHLRQPKQEFERLFALLQPYGILAVMTKLVIDAEAFAKWHYKNDPTHICFYSRESLQWLAYRYQKMVEFIGNDVIIFSGQA